MAKRRRDAGQVAAGRQGAGRVAWPAGQQIATPVIEQPDRARSPCELRHRLFRSAQLEITQAYMKSTPQ